ncbi:MAG: DUF3299 domain-containing protein [Bacteroidia bacterium]|nr:DUF3299 domain-containing protein [Bacteroidia bacterium]
MGTAFSVGGPQKITWEMLSDVTFVKEYNDLVDANVWKPTFGGSVLALEGEEISITGYVITVDIASDYVVLSSNPFAACFFCGNAGPETVLELRLKPDHKRFSTDEVATFKGRLKLNRSDITALNYILEDADIVR